MVSVSVRPRLVGIGREGPAKGSGPHLTLSLSLSHISFMRQSSGQGVLCAPCLA